MNEEYRYNKNNDNKIKAVNNWFIDIYIFIYILYIAQEDTLNNTDLHLCNSYIMLFLKKNNRITHKSLMWLSCTNPGKHFPCYV